MTVECWGINFGGKERTWEFTELKILGRAAVPLEVIKHQNSSLFPHSAGVDWGKNSGWDQMKVQVTLM